MRIPAASCGEEGKGGLEQGYQGLSEFAVSKLHVVDGLMLGEHFDLSAPRMVIGRSQDNDIVITDDRISRHHCAIEHTGSTFLLKDLGSSNGTFVNGRAITQTPIFDGDEIRLGGHLLVLSLSEGSDSDVPVVIVPENGGMKSTTVEIVIPNDDADFLVEHIGRRHSPERLLRDLGIIYQVSNFINGVHNHARLLKTILDMAFEAVEAEHGFLVLIEEHGDLVVKARRFGDRGTTTRSLSISRTIADIVLERGQGVLVNDALHDTRFSMHESIIAHRLQSVLCVPLKCKGKILGFIHLDNPSVASAFSTDDLRLVSAIAIQAGVALENSRLFKALEDLMFGSIGALVATVEAKDHYIKGHSERVARISRAVGGEMNLPYETMKVVHLSALLHDIGKIGISEAILNKKGPLTEQERVLIQEHPARGAEILDNIQDMAEVVRVVRHHHEFFGGNGYPDGISGDEIPLPSRIITVADAYDAMTSDRPYRNRLSQETCLSEIVRCSGTHFDPAVVEALLRSVRKHHIVMLAEAS